MKLMIQGWKDNINEYEAEFEETSFVDYEPNHRMDDPAECIITIADPTGALAQKYNTITNIITYVGPGKVTVEDPDGTDFYFGRILKVETDTAQREVRLHCEDWLSQLDDLQIDYDMREDLDSDDDTGEQGLRESTLHADADNTVVVAVAYNDGAGNYYIYDDARSWNADEFNATAYYLVWNNAMAGKNTWRFFPYTSTATDDDGYDDAPEAVWTDDSDGDNARDRGFANNDWTLDYTFHAHLGNNIPSDFYVHGSISAAVIHIKVEMVVSNSLNHIHMQIYDNDAGVFVSLTSIHEAHEVQEVSFTVPEDILPFIVNDSGNIVIRYDCDVTGGSIDVRTFFLHIDVTTETIGTSVADLILDTLDLAADAGKVNCLKTTKDFTAAAQQLWEGVKYAIAKKIHRHIDTAEGGTLISAGDLMVELTAAATIEHTSGISTRQYIKRTRLEILKDLLKQDRAHMWMALGTTTVIWKSTFGAATETLTDTDVNSYSATLDFSKVANKFFVKGMRIGDNQLEAEYADTGSRDRYHAVRSRTISGSGIVSEQDALSVATINTNKYKDARLMLQANIAGNTAKATHDKTLVVGDVVSITSAYYALSAVDYVVQAWSYSTRIDLTTLTLHPKASVIGMQALEKTSFTRAMNAQRRGIPDRFIPAPAETII